MFTNWLFLIFLGVSIVLSLIFAKAVSYLKFPLIVGYIIAGAIIGPDIVGLINDEQIKALDVINTITLSFLGFGIGGELRFSELKRLGKSIFTIVILEATMAYVLVGVSMALLLKSIPMGLIYGALAAATAPAGTVDVINQYKAKGELTTTLYAVMGLDDIYALLIYTISIPLAVILLKGNSADVSISHAMLYAGLEVVYAVGIGFLIGFIMSYIGKKIHDKTTMLLFSLGVILVGCGVSELLHISPILLNMASGIVLINYKPMVAKKIFNSLSSWTPPLYVWFFILIGSRLDHKLIIQFASLTIVYMIARSFGKWFGAFGGAVLSKASDKVRKYLGLALLSQAGVAIGLAIAAAKTLEKAGMHNEASQLISVLTATTFLAMLVGPISTKIALFKSGEAKVLK